MEIKLVAASNTLAPALCVLNDMGYQVEKVENNPPLYKAVSATSELLAEDILSLLGLAKILEVRGKEWQPTDLEVERLMVVEGVASM